MATITSATSGNYGTGATWMGGIAPVEGDKVIIARTSTALETFSTDVTGYAIGATAITLTGAVVAGSYVIGESVQFGSDPNYYKITNWVSGTKVLTVEPLIIAIPSSATLVKAKGHVVVVDGTYICGDDTTTALTVNGTITPSRTVNSSFRMKGDIQMAASIAATLDWGKRSVNSPIPLGITAELILNYSAAMANYKYGLFIGEGANVSFCGVTRKRNTVTTSSLSALDVSVDVADITGWAVNDWVIIGETTGIMAQYDRKQIVTVTPTTGTAGTITFSAVTYAHATGAPIGNFSSNVTVKSHNTTNPAYFCNRYTTTASNNRREIDYTTFEYVGSDSSLTSTKVWVSSGLSTEANPLRTFESCSFYQGNNSVGLFMSQFNTTTVFRDIAFFSDISFGGGCVYTAAGTYIQLEDSVFYYMRCIGHASGFSQGGQGATFRRCKFWANGSNFSSSIVNGSGIEYIDCQWHSTEPTGTAFCFLGSGDATYTTCSFGGSDLPGTPACGYLLDAGYTSGQVGSFRFNDCRFMNPATSFYRRITIANPKYISYISNKNLDPLVQEIYTPNGTIIRDNTSKISGVTSLKMTPSSATNALTFTLQIPAPTGKKVGVSGYLWRDTANTTTVTLSGLGITPSVYTASGSLSANEQFFVSGTQVTGTDGILTLTISTTGASGNLWVDAVSAPQAAAIDFGEFNYWSGGLPTQLMTASFTSAGDVWNYLASNVNVSGSMGKKVKAIWNYLYGEV